MSKENIDFPELDARIAEFLAMKRSEGSNPEIIFDSIEGTTVPMRTVCVLSESILRDFTQARLADGTYGSIFENWTSTWHARLLLEHLDKKERPIVNEGESGR